MLGIVEAIIFGLGICIIVFNAYFFVYKQCTYRIYFILTFYILSFIVFLARFLISLIIIIGAEHYDPTQAT